MANWRKIQKRAIFLDHPNFEGPYLAVGALGTPYCDIEKVLELSPLQHGILSLKTCGQPLTGQNRADRGTCLEKSATYLTAVYFSYCELDIWFPFTRVSPKTIMLVLNVQPT